jgi:hypothetical protein
MTENPPPDRETDDLGLTSEEWQDLQFAYNFSTIDPAPGTVEAGIQARARTAGRARTRGRAVTTTEGALAAVKPAPVSARQSSHRTVHTGCPCRSHPELAGPGRC